MAVTTAAQTDRPDIREMIVVHNTFRRGFGDLPGLIRGVAAGDRDRAQVVTGFLTELTAGLHHHHTGEDELLWPKLLHRVDVDHAFVLRAEEQHERVAELIERIEGEAAAFAASGSAADRDRLAASATALNDALCEHMADEERYVLPLVERFITVAEWQELADRGRAAIPKERLLVQVGWILDGLPERDRKEFLAHLPLAARVAWRLAGKRQYRRELHRVYGR
jgi:iron-sulfur cluster repair protein YtfE (RIC family)